ncbi:DUF6884 domain-containing protein [Alteromonas antoniana]|uniref:DUF6884 domain-containing protein n=1 Tax=Alteromonas antoniana TaxID=2803813 RepID=UPI001C46F5B3|nr:DUF6884 domain-containing protein [Alteromonas antoniana]
MKKHIPLVVIPCTAKKNSCFCPAIDMYQGTGYRSVVLASGARRGIDYNLAFLSAEYGLVMADQYIHPYERKLQKRDVTGFVEEHAASFEITLTQCSPSEIVACLPKLYAYAFSQLIESTEFDKSVKYPPEGAGIGTQRGFLKSHLEDFREVSFPVWCMFRQHDGKELITARLKLTPGDRFRPWLRNDPETLTPELGSLRTLIAIDRSNKSLKAIDEKGNKWCPSAIWFGLSDEEKSEIRRYAKLDRDTESREEIEVYLSTIREGLKLAA